MAHSCFHRMYGPWLTSELTTVRPWSELNNLLQSILNRAMSMRPQIKSLLQTELGNVAPLHVSLTRPLLLSIHDKDTFQQTFMTTMRSLKSPSDDTLMTDFRAFCYL